MLKKKWADEEKKISGGNGFIAKIKNDRIYFFTLEFFFFSRFNQVCRKFTT